MSSNGTVRRAWILPWFVWGIAIGMMFGFAVCEWVTMNRWFTQGVIAATRGTHTARLVEKADGTNEWVVSEVKGHPRITRQPSPLPRPTSGRG